MTLKDDINSALYSDQVSEKYYEPTKSGTGCVFRDQTDVPYFKPSVESYKVVPGTFLHQDLIAPNPAYNLIDPSVTDSKLTTVFSIAEIGDLKKMGVPAIGALAYTPDKVRFLFSGDKTFDLQDPDLNCFVLYSHDANSCDKRAICIKDQTHTTITGWQGPYLWDQGAGNLGSEDRIGAGAWPMGNPYYDIPDSDGNGKGGGSGYHCADSYEDAKSKGTNFKTAVSKIDLPGQEDYVDEYEFFKYNEYNKFWWNRNNLDDWWQVLDAWYRASIKEPNLQGWNPHNRLDTFGWVDRMAAMISLQNGFYWNRDKLGFDLGVQTSHEWWGWNEIPFDRPRATNPGCWDCLAIVMPLNADVNDWSYPYSNLTDLQKKYVKDLVDMHYDMQFKYGGDIAILQQQWFNNECITLVCQDVISYANLLKQNIESPKYVFSTLRLFVNSWLQVDYLIDIILL